MLRICDSCGEVDDGPRHMLAFEPGAVKVNTEMLVAVSANPDISDDDKERILADIADTTLLLKHMHCCKADGCPTKECDALPDLRGDELRAHIVGGS